MRYCKCFILLGLMFILSNCNPREEGIDPTFVKYFDLFIEEAALRGQTYSHSDIRGMQFGEIESNTTDGLCYYATNDIIIDQENWQDASESSRTSLIFHELGHCVLERRHISPEFLSGVCKSIMAGGDDATCIKGYRLGSVWYDYYNDELFDEDTPEPEWYVTEVDQPILETYIDTMATTIMLDIVTSDIDLSQNFEIISSFNNWKANDKIVLNLGEQRFMISEDLIYLDEIFLNRDPVTEETTSIRFVQYKGLDYFFVDDEMFHMDNLDLDFTSLNISVENVDADGVAIDMEFKLNLLED